jgi:hypothetical protein
MPHALASGKPRASQDLAIALQSKHFPQSGMVDACRGPKAGAATIFYVARLNPHRGLIWLTPTSG